MSISSWLAGLGITGNEDAVEDADAADVGELVEVGANDDDGVAVGVEVNCALELLAVDISGYSSSASLLHTQIFVRPATLLRSRLLLLLQQLLQQ